MELKRSGSTHLAFQESLEGIAVDWLEKVTEEQYEYEEKTP